MKIPKFLSSKNIWSMSIVFVVVLSAFLLAPWHEAKAADASEYVYFRIDTELDVLEAKTALTVDWSCDGAASGSITDNTASESTQALDGIVKVASASAEWTGSTCSTKNGGTIRAKTYVNGWVTRRWTAVFLASTSYSSAFTTTASMDYDFVAVGPIKDELGGSHVLNGSTASVSFSGTVASSSYYGGNRYLAVTTTGILTGGIDNTYVDKTVSTSWSNNFSTVSQSADFNVAITSTYNGSQLPYGVKVTYNTTNWRGETSSYTQGATIVAGTSLGVSCTGSSSSVNDANYNYYCLVPATETGTTAQATLATYTTSNTCTYTAPRTSNSASQSTCTIAAVQPITVTEGGAGPVQLPAEATPTPTPTPTAPAEVTPTPSLSPTPIPVSATLYRKANDPKVYVQGSDGTLSWVKTIEEFNAAGYKWSDVKTISGSEFAQMKISEGTALVTATLFRKANDPKVYVQGSDGTLSWVKTIEAFNAAGYKWADVKTISGTEFGKMRIGGNVRVVKGVAFLRVRSGPSTANKVVGQVLPGQELKFTEMKNGWYHIDSGWISGAYAKEF